MNIEKNDEKEYISVIAISVKDPETGYGWDCWEKYTRFQMSIADKCLDKDMESEAARLMNLGFKVLDTRVICCLTETSYDKSILDKLKDKDSFIVNYIN